MARRIDITDQVKAFGNFNLSDARVRINVDKVIQMVAKATKNVDRECNDGPIRISVPVHAPRLATRQDGGQNWLVEEKLEEAKAEKLPQ